MLEIYGKVYKYADTIASYQIKDNVLSLIIYCLSCREFQWNLIKFDMKSRREICNSLVELTFNKPGYILLSDNIIYACHNRVIFKYDIDDDNNVSSQRYVKKEYECICLVKIKNEVYIMMWKNDEDDTDNTYYFVNIKTDETYFKIIYKSKDFHMCDNHIYSKTKTWDDIYYYDNFLILCSENGYFERINLDTRECFSSYIDESKKECKSLIYMTNGEEFKRRNDDYESRMEVYERRNIIYFNEKNKGFYIYDFINETDTPFNYPIGSVPSFNVNALVTYFNYDGIDHYIKLNCEYDQYLTIDMNLSRNESVNDILKNNNILIGTQKYKVNMNLEILMNRSPVIRNLYKDFNNNVGNMSIISDNYDDMHIYKEYITNLSVYDDKNTTSNLLKLFKICNFLDDVDTKYISELMLINIKKNNVKIDKAFEYLDVFETAIHNEYFYRLLTIIFNKYNRDDVVNKLEKLNNNAYSLVVKHLMYCYK